MNYKQILGFFAIILLGYMDIAQQSAVYTNDFAEYNKTIDLYNNHQYKAAQKLFKEVKGEAKTISLESDCTYYIANCAVRLNQSNALERSELNKIIGESYFNLEQYGTSSKYINEYIGFNSRLDELQAYFLLEKLKGLAESNQQRRLVAQRDLFEIKNEKIKLPYWDESKNHVFHLFVVQVENRKKFVEFLEKNDVGYLIHYPLPPHQQKAFSKFSNLSFPVTEKIHEQVVSIPISPVMENSEISTVISVLNVY